MVKRSGVVAVAAMVVLAGCTGRDTISQWQFGFGRATIIDVVANSALPQVQTPAMRVMRFYAAQIAIVRLAEELPSRSNVRADFARMVENANGRLGDVLSCIFLGGRYIDALAEAAARSGNATNILEGARVQLDPNATADNQCFYFDSLLLEYGRSILDLARRLGDIESVANFSRQIQRAIGVSSLGALIGSVSGPGGGAVGAVTGLSLSQVIDLVGDLLTDILHSGRTLSALYRDFLTLDYAMLIERTNVPSIGSIGEAVTLAMVNDLYTRAGREPIPRIKHFAAMAILQLQACSFVTGDNAARDTCGSPPGPIFSACFDIITQGTEKVRALKGACRLTALPQSTRYVASSSTTR